MCFIFKIGRLHTEVETFWDESEQQNLVLTRACPEEIDSSFRGRLKSPYFVRVVPKSFAPKHF